MIDKVGQILRILPSKKFKNPVPQFQKSIMYSDGTLHIYCMQNIFKNQYPCIQNYTICNTVS